MSAEESVKFRYDNEIDLCIQSAHTKVLSFVGQRRRVLELGCSTGQMTRVMQERGCEVVAIEADAETAKRAAEHCDHVIVGDLEQMDFEVELGDRRFDVIVASDVLEHLKQPEAVLAALWPFLAPGGYVVASIPNVTHGSVRLALLSGSFPYADTGLLDRTHLRFYHRESLSEMLTAGGFSAVHVATVDLEIHRSEVPFELGPEAQAFVDALAGQPDALTYQFIVIAFPTQPPLGPIPRLIADLNGRIHELTYRRAVESEGFRVSLDAARGESAHLASEVARLGASEAQVAALQQQSDQLGSELVRCEAALGEIRRSTLWRLVRAWRFTVRTLRRG